MQKGSEQFRESWEAPCWESDKEIASEMMRLEEKQGNGMNPML